MFDRLVFLCFVFAIPFAPSSAQESPYVDIQKRDIKALSTDDIDGLLAGNGLGFALAAELNGMPGPRHVIDMQTELNLTDAQLKQTTSIFDSMQKSAIQVGKIIIEKERELDAVFASGSATPESVQELTGKIGSLYGSLRSHHLAAHIEMTSILTDEQRHKYQVLRGYANSETDSEHNHEHR